jgi:hypothetical protein
MGHLQILGPSTTMSALRPIAGIALATDVVGYSRLMEEEPVFRLNETHPLPNKTRGIGRGSSKPRTTPVRPNDRRPAGTGQRYSGRVSPDPPNSAGMSLNFGNPSFTETIFFP